MIIDYETVPAVEEVIRLMDEAGVDRAIAMSRWKNMENEKLWKSIGANQRFIGFAVLDPHNGESAVKELETAVRVWGFKGLKLMPLWHAYNIDNEVVYPLMEKSEELRITVAIHSGGYHCLPWQIADLAEVFPRIPIIMDHMGYRTYRKDCIKMAKKHDNLYLGTACVAEPAVIRLAAEQAGAHKIIYGSNAPSGCPEISIQVIKHARLSREDENLALGENLAKLLRLTGERT